MTSVSSDESLEDAKMPLTAHLSELRKRLVVSMAGILVVFIVCWNFSRYIIDTISAPVIPYVKNLQFDTLTDPFFTHMKAAFFAAVFLTFPLTLSQIWLFVAPGLYGKEKRIVWPFLFLSFPLFIGGAFFFYFVVFPFAVEFLITFDKTLVPSLRVGDYLSFTVRLLFVFGLVFEMPLISLLMTRLGVITPEWLSKSRRYAIVVIFIAAAILTPPDVITQLMLAGPLIVLFEISIIVSRLARRRDVGGAPAAAKSPMKTVLTLLIWADVLLVLAGNGAAIGWAFLEHDRDAALALIRAWYSTSNQAVLGLNLGLVALALVLLWLRGKRK